MSIFIQSFEQNVFVINTWVSLVMQLFLFLTIMYSSQSEEYMNACKCPTATLYYLFDVSRQDIFFE